ncbi:DUF2795 domain-containing protein [Azotobacter armeniacus]
MTRGVAGQPPANVMTYLKGSGYPAKKNRKHARQNDAGSEVLQVPQNMPEQEYGNMADVMKSHGDAKHYKSSNS